MTAVMEGFTFACHLSDLPQHGRRVLTVNDTRVLVVRCDDGLFVVEDIHPHGGRSLAHGKVMDCVITSPEDGAHYDLRTGEYLGGGSFTHLMHDSLRVLKTHVVGDDLYILI